MEAVVAMDQPPDIMLLIGDTNAGFTNTQLLDAPDDLFNPGCDNMTVLQSEHNNSDLGNGFVDTGIIAPQNDFDPNLVNDIGNGTMMNLEAQVPSTIDGFCDIEGNVENPLSNLSVISDSNGNLASQQSQSTITNGHSDDSNTAFSIQDSLLTEQTSDNQEESLEQSKQDKPKEKKKRNRTKNPDPAPEAILPPCKICNEKSSGYHYGVNSCEACKGFFRRTQKKKEVKFKCKCSPEEKERWKQGPYKNGCGACRYERCLYMGMSKNAIKIGRYTICHKNNNISEANEEKARKKNQNASSSPSPSSSNFIPEPDCYTADSLFDFAVNRAFQNSSPLSLSPESSDMTGSPSMSGLSDYLIEITSPPSTSSSISDQPSTSNKRSNTDTETEIDYKKRRLADSALMCQRAGISLKEIDTTVKIITESHKSTLFENDFHANAIKQHQTECLEKFKMEKELFGEMKALTEEEFFQFYKATGIDIDGRVEEIEKGLDFYNRKIIGMVSFGKSIPGFKRLCLEDQATLIKVNRMENVLLAGYKDLCRNIDWDSKVFVTPWGLKYHFEHKGHTVTYILEKTKFAEKIKALELSPQEEAILRAIAIVSTDRASNELKEEHKVLALQEQLMFCLQHLLNVRHDGPGNSFYRVVNLLMDLRNLGDFEQKFVQEVTKQPLISQALKNYALLREFLT